MEKGIFPNLYILRKTTYGDFAVASLSIENVEVFPVKQIFVALSISALW